MRCILKIHFAHEGDKKMNFIRTLITFTIENSEIITSLLAIITTVLTLMNPVFYLIKNKNDADSIIKKSILAREEKIIDDYFKKLSYKELTTIQKNDYRINNRIYNLIDRQSKNSLLHKFLDEITRTDRYKTVKFLLSKISNKTSMRRTFKLFLVVGSNYLFYFSKTIIKLLIYTISLSLILGPLYYIFLFFNVLYSFTGIYLLIIIIISISFILRIFGENKN